MHQLRVEKSSTDVINRVFNPILGVERTEVFLRQLFSPTTASLVTDVVPIIFMYGVKPMVWPVFNWLRCRISSFSSKSARGNVLLPLDLHLNRVEVEIAILTRLFH